MSVATRRAVKAKSISSFLYVPPVYTDAPSVQSTLPRVPAQSAWSVPLQITPQSSLPSAFKGEKANSFPMLSTLDTNTNTNTNIKHIEENSLAGFANHLKKKIVQRATSPIDSALDALDTTLFKKFQQSYENVKIDWTILMKNIISKMDYIDQCYKKYNYFGYKSTFLHYILNISLSFIIIGPNATNGSGIDNLDGTSLLHYFINDSTKENSTSIKDLISNFLTCLPSNTYFISEEYKTLTKLCKVHETLLNELSTNVSQIESLKKTIKALEKALVTPDKSDKKITQNIKEKITIASKSLINLQNKNTFLETKNSDTIVAKSKKKKEIYEKIKSMNNSLHFSYFMHKDWCPQIDFHLTQF